MTRHFSATREGEIPELKEELASQYKDSQDPNPLIPMLAARTMGCIHDGKHLNI